MELVTIFIAMLVGFLLIGIVFAVAQHGEADDEEDAEDEDEVRVTISQEVPSVFDIFRDGDK